MTTRRAPLYLKKFVQIYFDKLELSSYKLKKESLPIQKRTAISFNLVAYQFFFFLSYIHYMCNIGSISSVVIYSFFPPRWIIFKAELDVLRIYN